MPKPFEQQWRLFVVRVIAAYTQQVPLILVRRRLISAASGEPGSDSLYYYSS